MQCSAPDFQPPLCSSELQREKFKNWSHTIIPDWSVLTDWCPTPAAQSEAVEPGQCPWKSSRRSKVLMCLGQRAALGSEAVKRSCSCRSRILFSSGCRRLRRLVTEFTLGAAPGELPGITNPPCLRPCPAARPAPSPASEPGVRGGCGRGAAGPWLPLRRRAPGGTAEAWQALAVAGCELVMVGDTRVPSWQGCSAPSLVFRGRLAGCDAFLFSVLRPFSTWNFKPAQQQLSWLLPAWKGLQPAAGSKSCWCQPIATGSRDAELSHLWWAPPGQDREAT